MNQQLKNSTKTVDHPFFYKDGLSVLDNPPKEDKIKDNLRNDISEIPNSNMDAKYGHQNLESTCKVNDNHSINQRIIIQLEEENQCLFQMTKIQQKRIKRLEEQLFYFSKGGRLFP